MRISQTTAAAVTSVVSDSVWPRATPKMAAHQAPLSLGFSRQEHWSGLPFPSPMHENEKWKGSRSVVSDPQRPQDYSLPGSSVHGIFYYQHLNNTCTTCKRTFIHVTSLNSHHKPMREANSYYLHFHFTGKFNSRSITSSKSFNAVNGTHEALTRNQCQILCFFLH